jgi:hypothetical protein
MSCTLSWALGRLAGMASGFDAGEALGGGLGDRRQAWDFIRRFAAEWATPLGPGDGISFRRCSGCQLDIEVARQSIQRLIGYLQPQLRCL